MRIAFVPLRCGSEVVGGSERLCLELARNLAQRHDVEILTTCALDYMTWENHYPEGPDTVEGVPVRRFAVDASRDIEAFNRLSEAVRAGLPDVSLQRQEEWMLAQGPISSGLKAYIQGNAENIDLFFFFTYLYATAYLLLPLVKDKAVLFPTAHDEWPIYLGMFDKLMLEAKGFIFNTHGEREFFRKRFPGVSKDGPVVGMGIVPPKQSRPAAFRKQTGINDPFLLYAGRVDYAKGCDELFDHFLRLKNLGQYPGKLVLIGKEVMDIPKHPDIIRLGFVDEQTKWDAMAACDWLVNPSPYESLSIVLLEAFCVERPGLVTGRSPVLVDQCIRSNGGLWYDDFNEFSHIVKTIDSDLKHRLGAEGKKFVERNYTWDVITQKLCNYINNIT